VESPKWDYEGFFGHNADVWANRCTGCKGHKQAPMDINSASAVYDKTLATPAKALKLTTYNKVVSTQVINTKRYAQILYTGKKENGAIISGGPLKSKYVFHQASFHVGAHGEPGSQQTIDGAQSAMEVRLLNYNTKYLSYADAAKKPDGLLYLVIRVEKGDAANSQYQPVLNAIKKIQSERAAPLTGFKFSPFTLLPADTTKYYIYDGSLTIPPCSENAKQLVLADAVSLTDEQIDIIREVKDEHGHDTTNNIRKPVYNDSARKVTKSFSDE